jgi:hypothetical protein
MAKKKKGKACSTHELEDETISDGEKEAKDLPTKDAFNNIQTFSE